MSSAGSEHLRLRGGGGNGRSDTKSGGDERRFVDVELMKDFFGGPGDDWTD